MWPIFPHFQHLTGGLGGGGGVGPAGCTVPSSIGTTPCAAGVY